MSKKLTDCLDVTFLQKFQDAFSGATGLASICSDLEGPVTKPSNFTSFCIDYTRATKEGSRRCIECGLQAGKESKRMGKECVYTCHAGLIDFSAPIIIDGEQVGTITGGQVLPGPPDENKFRSIAAEIGVNPDDYIAALRKVKIVPEERIRQAASLLYLTVEQITQMYTQFEKLALSYDIVKKEVTFIGDQINHFAQSVEGISDEQKDLLDRLITLNNVIDSINAIVEAVRKISQKTQIISVNASIESARSGVHGKSFNVIAQEIRSLSNETLKTVSQIEVYTEQILKAVEAALKISRTSIDSLKDQSDGISAVIPHLNNIIHEMQQLNKKDKSFN